MTKLQEWLRAHAPATISCPIADYMRWAREQGLEVPALIEWEGSVVHVEWTMALEGMEAVYTTFIPPGGFDIPKGISKTVRVTLPEPVVVLPVPDYVVAIGGDGVMSSPMFLSEAKETLERNSVKAREALTESVKEKLWLRC